MNAKTILNIVYVKSLYSNSISMLNIIYWVVLYDSTMIKHESFFSMYLYTHIFYIVVNAKIKTNHRDLNHLRFAINVSVCFFPSSLDTAWLEVSRLHSHGHYDRIEIVAFTNLTWLQNPYEHICEYCIEWMCSLLLKKE